MARRKRNPASAQLSLPGVRRAPKRARRGPADTGLYHGPFEAESYVTHGRRARGRRRATVYGPVQSPSSYKAKRRSRRKPAAARRRRSGGKGRTAAQRRAFARMMAGLRRYRAGKGRKRRRVGTVRRKRATARRRSGGKGRTAAQRRAFTRMMAGLRRYRAGKGRKRRGAARRGRARMPSKRSLRRFVRALPKKAELRVFSGVRRGGKVRGYTVRNPRKNPRGGYQMARKHRRRRSRRNPALDIKGTVKQTLKTAIPAVAGGALMSIIDSKLLSGRSQLWRIGGKVAAAALVSVALRRRAPAAAQVMMGAMLGSLGYELGARLSGGVVTTTPQETAKAMGLLIRDDPAAMGALIDASGALYTTPSLGGMGIPSMSTADVNLG